MGKRQFTHGLLELDARVTPRVRVRRWRHRGGEVPRWPTGAHDAVEIAWSEQGTLTYQAGRAQVHAAPGEAVVVPAQMEHRTDITSGTVATSIWLSAAVVAEMAELMESPARLLRFGVVQHDTALPSLGSLMLDEATRSDSGAFVTTDALAEALAVRLLRAARPLDDSGPTGGGGGSDPRISRAIEAVEDRYSEPLTIDELAHTAGMSRYHFSRTFRAQVGQSPYQFLVTTRVRRAAELLRRGRHSVTEAAYGVGFHDLGRFARAFQKQMGCAPSAYA